MAVIIIAAVASGLGAVVSRVTALDSENGRAIAYQVLADRIEGANVDRLVETMDSLGPGRVYAGTVSNWGSQFRVGYVPVYKYLETQNVDVMVYSATTTTLMDDPEFFFNERVPGDYALFGVRYLLMPVTMTSIGPRDVDLLAGQLFVVAGRRSEIREDRRHRRLDRGEQGRHRPGDAPLCQLASTRTRLIPDSRVRGWAGCEPDVAGAGDPEQAAVQPGRKRRVRSGRSRLGRRGSASRYDKTCRGGTERDV